MFVVKDHQFAWQDVVEILLDHGASPNTKDAWRWAGRLFVRVVFLVVVTAGRCSGKCNGFMAPKHLMVHMFFVEKVSEDTGASIWRYLLMFGWISWDYPFKKIIWRRCTPLHNAAGRGYLEIVRYVMIFWSIPSAVGGIATLCTACSLRYLESITMLMFKAPAT